LNRDGQVKWLPEKLPSTADFVWSAELMGPGIGGIAVADGRVIVTGRDHLDRLDVIQCFDAETGEARWQHTYQALGKLDYGNSPRATPMVHAGCVYTLGALGDLYCLELESGIPLWHRNLLRDFNAKDLTWGHSGSPLVVSERLILQPGGPEASLVGLDLDTGETLWQTPGLAASYASLLAVNLNGISQVVGYDQETMGGWDPETGKRLWSYQPERKGDFNVPTILQFEHYLIATTENNGTRLFKWDLAGKLELQPAAVNFDLAPDTHTPVISQGHVVGVNESLVALSLADQFDTIRQCEDPAFYGYASLIAGPDRVLAFTERGELLLMQFQAGEIVVSSRLVLEEGLQGILSHPAIAGKAFFARLGKRLVRLNLE
jgi:outer membrane protein assembly factor BamB